MPPEKKRIPYTERDLFRDHLKTVLRSASDEGFIQLLWATNVLQSDHSDSALPYIHGFKPEAATSDLLSPWAIYKWDIEDLANELFSIPKRPLKNGQREIDYRDFQSLLRIAGTLRALHNAEDGIELIVVPVFSEMRRVIARQFDWQRGFLNQPQFYRSAFVYGQGASARYFENKTGLSVNDLSIIGFGVYSFLMDHRAMAYDIDWSQLGISAAQAKMALDIFVTPAETARKVATELRRSPGHSGYKPSFLRRFPCILFDGARIRSPLPQLILERVTSGLFFDVVDGGGDVRGDYGRRFEEYCVAYLRAMLPALQFAEEWRYGSRKATYDTPDIICRRGDTIELALECKATRMSFAAKFSTDPLAERGYEDVVKGVFQLWRFFSHCRRGLVKEKLSPEAVGVVLTLEAWLVMSGHLYEGVLERARTMCTEDPDILDEDRRPVEFCSITDLESALAQATEASFLDAVREGAKPDNYGWMFVSIHERFVAEGIEEKPYPFAGELGKLLPWWNMVERHENDAE